MDRRSFLRRAGVVAAAGFAPSFWRRAFATPAPSGPGPYGPIGTADENGIRLPAGFTSRVIARGGQAVPGTAYVWHTRPDGGATFRTVDLGWIYVSNSEASSGGGGAGAVRFDSSGTITDAYRILDGTSRNCAGGPTPWGSWLSCEEVSDGLVWECDPNGLLPARPLPGLGVFNHEAAAVDPLTASVYLTEDESDGCLYRFRPLVPGVLLLGTLEVATLAAGDPRTGPVGVSWTAVPDPSATGMPTRHQIPSATRFRRGEGAWFDSGVAYFTTTSDHRVWAYDTLSATIEVIYDADTIASPPLREPDNITVAPSGDIYVAEDDGDLGLEMITREHVAASFLRLSGSTHSGSELAGPAFSPDGSRLYFSSQRAGGSGITYEIAGPFRA